MGEGVSGRFDPQASTWAVDDEAYHADREHENNTSLGVFRKSVRMYHGIYVTGEIQRPPPTKGMQFGKAFHLLVLEPDRWEANVATCPSAKKTTKAGRAEWDAFAAENEDRIWITEDEEQSLRRMYDSVMSNPASADLMKAPGAVEEPIRFRDARTGIWCKVRPDKLLDDGTIIDLKYSHEPYEQEFARSVVNYQYYAQAALYEQGVAALKHASSVPHVFIVCGDNPPNECIVYALDEEAMQLGRSVNLNALTALRDCRDLNAWDGRHHGQINTIALPRYAFSKSLVY